MVTVWHCCNSKQRILKQLEFLVKVIKKTENYSFDVKIVLNQHHTEIRTRQQLKTDVWKEAANSRKISRDCISGTRRCKFWKRHFFRGSVCVGLADVGQLPARSKLSLFTVQKYLQWFATGLTRISLSFSESTVEWAKEQIKIQYLALSVHPQGLNEKHSFSTRTFTGFAYCYNEMITHFCWRLFTQGSEAIVPPQ